MNRVETFLQQLLFLQPRISYASVKHRTPCPDIWIEPASAASESSNCPPCLRGYQSALNVSKQSISSPYFVHWLGLQQNPFDIHHVFRIAFKPRLILSSGWESNPLLFRQWRISQYDALWDPISIVSFELDWELNGYIFGENGLRYIVGIQGNT